MQTESEHKHMHHKLSPENDRDGMYLYL